MSARTSRRNRKIAAIAAGALVVGVGATYTLATWNDSEWVWGGAGGDPGIGTETFNVQQNTIRPLVEGNWTDKETNPGGELIFSADALALTPGDTIYAPVSLRSVEKSIAGTLELQSAVAAEGTPSNPQNDAALWDAVQVDVWTHSGETPLSCTAAGVSTGWTQIVTSSALGSESPSAQTLAAAPTAAGTPQNYCFAITLPATPSGDPDNKALQGLKISPAWEFKAESN